MIRKFDSGATRDTDENKYDYEGFLHPLVLMRFSQYMNKHRVCSDGSTRDSDNWQKGIPMKEYIKSLIRHVMDLWLLHRDCPAQAREGIQDALCGILFNVQGYLLEHIKKYGLQTSYLPDYTPIQGNSCEGVPGFCTPDRDKEERDVDKGDNVKSVDVRVHDVPV